MDRLGGRLKSFRLLDQAGFSDHIEKIGHIFTKEMDKGGSTNPILTGMEYRRLMLVPPKVILLQVLVYEASVFGT